MCYLPVEEAIGLMPKLPSPSPVLRNLTYVYEENLSRDGEFGGSEFGGYPTLKQRNDSFDIRESMRVHCGYVLLFIEFFPTYISIKECSFVVIVFYASNKTLLFLFTDMDQLSIFNDECIYRPDF